MKIRITSAILKTVILFVGLCQFAYASRKFLTGLIIGTLLARNGMQQSPVYPMPYPSSGQQQQPLFIIIPSTSGKSHKPHIVPASHYASRSYTDSVPYPQNLLLRRSIIRNKPMRYSQRTPLKQLLDKQKQQVARSGGKTAFTNNLPDMVRLSDQASKSSPESLIKTRKATKRQVSSAVDDFLTAASIQTDWPTD